MIAEKKLKAIIHYKDFLLLDENQIINILENKDIEFLISIKKDEYEKLEAAEKEKLYGFRRTEIAPLKKPIIDKEKIFVLQNLPEIKDVKITEQSFKEKHYQKSRPPAPRKIFNAGYNSKKKGGR